MKKALKKSAVTHVRFDESVLRQVEAFAKRENRTLAGAVVHLTTRMLAVVTPKE